MAHEGTSFRMTGNSSDAAEDVSFQTNQFRNCFFCLKKWFTWKRVIALTCAILAVVIAFAILLYFSVWPFSKNEHLSSGVCTTNACKQASYHLTNPPLDRTVNICHNYLGFMCREDNSSEARPQEREESRHREKLGLRWELVQKILRKLELTTAAERFWSGFYAKCVQHKTDYENEQEAYKAITKAEGWPLTDSSTWVKEGFDLTAALIKMAKFGVRNFKIFQLKFSFDFDYEYEVYKLLIRKTVENFKTGDERLSKDVARHTELVKNGGTESLELGEVISFAERLEHIEDKVLLNSNELDREAWASLADLEKWVPAVNWRRLLNSLIPEDRKSMTVDWDALVMVYPREYFENHLPALLEGTKIETLVEFFHYISTMTALHLLPNSKVSERQCDQILNRTLSRIPLSQNFDDAREKRDVEEELKLAEAVRQEFIEVMIKNKWMDEESKARAVLKLERMQIKSVYNEDPRAVDYDEKLYRGLEVKDTDTFLDLLLIVLEWTMKTNTLSIIEHEEIYVDYPYFQCHYHTVLNIFIVGTFLDTAFLNQKYNYEAPGFLKWATLGKAYGAEMARMFDEHGIKWGIGLGHEPVLTNVSMKKYDEMRECVVEISKGGVNLKLDEDDNVGFLMGLKVSYQANKKLGIQVKLENFENVDENILFFYSLAKQYCPVYGNLADNPVNRLLSTFDEFTKTFNCEEGSPMNRKDKCAFF